MLIFERRQCLPGIAVPYGDSLFAKMRHEKSLSRRIGFIRSAFPTSRPFGFSIRFGHLRHAQTGGAIGIQGQFFVLPAPLSARFGRRHQRPVLRVCPLHGRQLRFDGHGRMFASALFVRKGGVSKRTHYTPTQYRKATINPSSLHK